MRTLPMTLAGAAILALALTGCVPNHPASGNTVTVAVTDDTCSVTESTTTAGVVTFTITNSGTDLNEFEVLADDKLRIVAEKENVAPGQTVSLAVQLEPGSYYTACKFQQAGAAIGLAAFTVTGDAVAVTASEQEQVDAAVTSYIAYVKSQVSELTPAVAALTSAYIAGDDGAARSLFAAARVSYERIEPTAEAFGDLDPKIDYREVDALAEGLDWTGFHRIEKDLWPPASGAVNSDGTDALAGWAPSTPAERLQYGQGLVDNVKTLSGLVNGTDFTVSLADISNGAIGLLDEVAASKITGEEDWWSHTDLFDFQANVQGAEVAFGNVKSLAAGKSADGATLVSDIETQFAALDALLAQYGSLDSGFVFYDTVTDAQRKDLSDQVNALAEPLSKLTHAVLGVDG